MHRCICCCLAKRNKGIGLFFRPMVAVASTTSFLISAAAVVWQLLSAGHQAGAPVCHSPVCEVTFPEPIPQEHVCVCSQEVHCQYPSPGPLQGRPLGEENSGSLAVLVAAASGGFSLGLVAGLCICCKLSARRQEVEAPVSLIRDGGHSQRRPTLAALPY